MSSFFGILTTFMFIVYPSNSDKTFDHFGKTTTAHEIYLDTNSNLKGKLAIVTGSTSGLGKETVRILAMTECTVIMAGRNTDKNEAVKQELINAISNVDPSQLHTNLVPMTLDLASLQSILDFATNISNKYSQQSIDILVNNAGIVLPNYTLTADGFEQQFGVNHLGHYYLTRLLINKLTQSRVITISSSAHFWAPRPISKEINDHLPPKADRYNHRTNYAISKICNILFARELQRRFGGNGLISMSVHPGDWIKTEIMNNLDDSIQQRYNGRGSKDIERGTATQIFCALIPAEQLVGGGYYDDCKLSNHRLRKDVREPKGFFGDGFDATDTDEFKLWILSEKLILAKSFAFEVSEKIPKTDL